MESVTHQDVIDSINNKLEEVGWKKFQENVDVSLSTIRNFRQISYLQSAKRLRRGTVNSFAKYCDPHNAETWWELLNPEKKILRVGMPFCIWSTPCFVMAHEGVPGIRFACSEDQQTQEILFDELLTGQFSDREHQAASADILHGKWHLLTAKDLVDDLKDGLLDCVVMAEDLKESPGITPVGKFLSSGPGPKPLFYSPDTTYENPVEAWEKEISNNTSRVKVYYAPGTVAQSLVEDLRGKGYSFSFTNDVASRTGEFIKTLKKDIENKQRFVVLTWAPFSLWMKQILENELGDQIKGRIFIEALADLADTPKNTGIKFWVYVQEERARSILDDELFKRFWHRLGDISDQINSGKNDEPSPYVAEIMSKRLHIALDDVQRELSELDFGLSMDYQLALNKPAASSNVTTLARSRSG